MKTSVIIVAAGRGTRMGPGIDKIFLPLAGRPLIAHTWQRFNDSPSIRDIVLVVRDGMEREFAQMASEFSLTKPHRFVTGGKERQHSVWNGLEAASHDTELVAIQDGARPCTTEKIIADTIAAAWQTGAAVAAQRVTDTLKESNSAGQIQRNVDRTNLWAVQTPQVFRTAVIRDALKAVFDRNLLVTDDTAACELIGQPVQLVESTSPNPKATSPADLPIIEAILKRPV